MAPGDDRSAGPAAARVDSILPTREALARFMSATPKVDRLKGGATTREELVRKFFVALEQRDGTALAAIAVTRSEYGSLYYPTSIYSRKPYELAPDIAWLLNSENSAKGARRMLERLGGRRHVLLGVDCRDSTGEGSNLIWSGCTVRYRNPAGQSEERRLFRAIIRREGELKFLSYAGDF